MGAYLYVENHLETQLSSSSSNNGSGNPEYVTDWDMSHFESYNTSGIHLLTYNLTNSTGRDTVIVWGCNGIATETLDVVNAANSAALGSVFTQGDRRPILINLVYQVTNSYNFVINSATSFAKGMRHIWLGDRVEIPGGVNIGFDDPRYGRDTQAGGGLTRGGTFASLFSSAKSQSANIVFEIYDDSWFDNNWNTIADHIAAGKPFYLGLDIDTTQNVLDPLLLLCWSQRVPRVNWSGGLTRTVTLNVECVRK